MTSDALTGSVFRTKFYSDLAVGVTLFVYQEESQLHVLVLVYKFTTVIPITIIYNLCLYCYNKELRWFA